VEGIQRFDTIRRRRAGKTGLRENAREQPAASRVIVRYQDSLVEFLSRHFL
jgi:hypothetical protein